MDEPAAPGTSPLKSALSSDRPFTYRDYKAWPEGERWELIHGEAYAFALRHNSRGSENYFTTHWKRH